MTDIKVAELKEITSMLLSHIEQSGKNNMTISEDFYWEIPQNLRYDKYDPPKNHTVGQLSDDISELKRMLEGKAPVVGYGLVWLAAVLRRLGETANS